MKASVFHHHKIHLNSNLLASFVESTLLSGSVGVWKSAFFCCGIESSYRTEVFQWEKRLDRFDYMLNLKAQMKSSIIASFTHFLKSKG